MNLEKLTDVIDRKDCLNFLGNRGRQRGRRLAADVM